MQLSIIREQSKRKANEKKMNETEKRAVILWLSGIGLPSIRGIEEVETLMQQGITVELDPTSITGNQAHHYQVMTGRRPEHSGFFDTLVLQDYTVKENFQGHDNAPASLITSLNAAGWTVEYRETVPSELVACLRAWTKATMSSACLVVKCIFPLSVGDNASTDLAQAIRLARSAVGYSGLLALLSDAQPALVKQFVNLNNFLADMGIIERHKADGSIDWSNSISYFMGYGQLWVNLRGRDALGIVQRENEYEEVCATLIQALPQKLRDPQTGQTVIAHVYRKEELYSGEYLFCAPDLVVQFQPGYIPSARSTRLDFDETAFTTAPAGTTAINGAHPDSISGFLIASASAFRQGTKLSMHAPLTAVAPTVLHALGVKHGFMDSIALQECFAHRYLDAHPLHPTDQQQELSEEEKEVVLNRLRDLGYI
jgi:hypothetical protein